MYFTTILFTYIIKKILKFNGVQITLQWDSCDQTILWSILIKLWRETIYIYFSKQGAAKYVITKLFYVWCCIHSNKGILFQIMKTKKLYFSWLKFIYTSYTEFTKLNFYHLFVFLRAKKHGSSLCCLMAW